ncbi:hypothetical protein J6590_028867 [Homalodisca vitripennis]|nr:hypothetical protein J6590_028867 [Homalodisca vitripennis]
MDFIHIGSFRCRWASLSCQHCVCVMAVSSIINERLAHAHSSGDSDVRLCSRSSFPHPPAQLSGMPMSVRLEAERQSQSSERSKTTWCYEVVQTL